MSSLNQSRSKPSLQANAWPDDCRLPQAGHRYEVIVGSSVLEDREPFASSHEFYSFNFPFKPASVADSTHGIIRFNTKENAAEVELAAKDAQSSLLFQGPLKLSVAKAAPVSSSATGSGKSTPLRGVSPSPATASRPTQAEYVFRFHDGKFYMEKLTATVSNLKVKTKQAEMSSSLKKAIQQYPVCGQTSDEKPKTQSKSKPKTDSDDDELNEIRSDHEAPKAPRIENPRVAKKSRDFENEDQDMPSSKVANYGRLGRNIVNDEYEYDEEGEPEPRKPDAKKKNRENRTGEDDDAEISKARLFNNVRGSIDLTPMKRTMKDEDSDENKNTPSKRHDMTATKRQQKTRIVDEDDDSMDDDSGAKAPAKSSRSKIEAKPTPVMPASTRPAIKRRIIEEDEEDEEDDEDDEDDDDEDDEDDEDYEDDEDDEDDEDEKLTRNKAAPAIKSSSLQNDSPRVNPEAATGSVALKTLPNAKRNVDSLEEPVAPIKKAQRVSVTKTVKKH